MNLPISESLGLALIWESYIVAQAATASLGVIPGHALAFGVEVTETGALLRFQFTEVDETDQDEIDDVVSEMGALVGDDVEVRFLCEVRDALRVSSADGVHWVYLARLRGRGEFRRRIPDRGQAAFFHRYVNVERCSRPDAVEGMVLPTPEDPGLAPIWENYVMALVAEVSAGLIPEHALALGVEVDGARVVLRFQLSEVDEADRDDMEAIVGEVGAFVGEQVEVRFLCEVRGFRQLDPDDGVCWVYASYA